MSIIWLANGAKVGSLVLVGNILVCSVQFSYYINNRQPNGSLSNVLSRLAVGVRVDGDDERHETQRKEHEREGDQEVTELNVTELN